MKKLWFLLIIIAFYSSLTANVVAKIEDKIIDSEELYEQMQQYSETDISLQEAYQKALDKLIEEKLLLVYAEENQINVEDNEIEAFIMNEFGNHPTLSTNSIFDRSKYEKFKKTRSGQQFIQKIRNDLLLSKTKRVLQNRFEVKDEVLLEQYIVENSNIDLSYALLNIDDLNSSVKVSPVRAFDFYQEHRHQFLTEPQVNFQFLVVPFSKYQPEIKKEVEAELQSLVQADSSLSATYLDSLYTFLVDEKTKKTAAQAVQYNQELWQKGLTTQFPIWESGFLSYKDSLGSLPGRVVKTAFKLHKNQISEPILVEEIGYLLVKNYRQKEPQPAELAECKSQVWQKFLATQKSILVDKKEYYRKNPEEFSIPAAVVRIITNIPPEVCEILTENFQDLATLRKLIRKYNLTDEIKVLYLDKFKNDLPYEDVIAKNILVERYDDLLQLKNNNVFYTTISIFPEYLPDYQDIKDQIKLEQVETIDFTSQDLKDYYQKNKGDFVAADSLQLGGVFYPVQPDTIKIKTETISNFYLNNQKLFYRNDSVVFDYICTNHRSEKLLSYLRNSDEFQLLKFCFGSYRNLPANKLTSYSALPDTIAKTLKNIPVNSFSQPVYYQNNWYILKKIKEHKAGILSFPDARPLIENQLKFSLADSIARAKAETVFDSTTYFDSCYRYAASDNIFKTQFRSASDDFTILGDISDYRKELLQLWRNEKYASIIHLEQGYAVIFLLKKKLGKQLSYEKALPQIKSIFNYEKKLGRAKNYAEFLKQLVKDGSDPEKIFYFLGGWHNIENLDLNSELPGIKYSKIIIEDISHHNAGYISPIIRISENQLLIYKINSINKVNEEDFQKNREKYRKQKLVESYENWLQRYRKTHNIMIYEKEN